LSGAVRAALIVLALCAVPASASAEVLRGPQDIRVARAADVLPRLSALYEEWRVTLVDPRSSSRAFFTVIRGVEGNQAELRVTPAGQYSSMVEFGAVPTGRRKLAWKLNWDVQTGSAALRRVHGGWRLRVDGPRGKANVFLGRARPGVTARRWRLGQASSGDGPVHLSWSTPVATSRASGEVRAADRSARVDGWRGTVEHRWGFFRHEFDVWNYETTAVAHGARSRAWVLHGLTHNAPPPNSDAEIDARWLGVLVRVTPRGTSWCRPRIVRRVWGISNARRIAAKRTVASCGSRRLALRRAWNVPSDITSIGDGHEQGNWAPASSPQGAPAWIRFTTQG
jgi:hypothetical protein